MNNQSSTLWRYIDLDKFHDLIEKDAQYFCRLDKLSDTQEGYRSAPSKKRDYGLFDLLQVPNIAMEFDEIEELSRTYSFVNCWNRSASQSLKMWKEYPDAKVVIKTTIDSLKSSIQSEPSIDNFKRTSPPRERAGEILKQIQFGDVIYLDKKTELSNQALSLGCFHKERNKFEFESEYRVCVQAWSWDVDDKGKPKPLDHVYVSIKLDSLIHEIFMRPASSIHEKKQVDAILEAKGLSIRVSD